MGMQKQCKICVQHGSAIAAPPLLTTNEGKPWGNDQAASRKQTGACIHEANTAQGCASLRKRGMGAACEWPRRACNSNFIVYIWHRTTLLEQPRASAFNTTQQRATTCSFRNAKQQNRKKDLAPAFRRLHGAARMFYGTFACFVTLLTVRFVDR